MKFLYKHPDFLYLVNKTAEKLNLPAIMVEKDYWVTFLLRNLVNSEFNEEIIFKGGTCLSKAWKLINRFSEDIDILLLETNQTKSKQSKGKRIKEMRDFINLSQELKLIDDKHTKLYASLRYSYPIAVSSAFSSSITSNILLEPGYRGGIKPEIIKKPINSLLGELLQDSFGEYDVEPFKINVLTLERIFIEKLFAIKALFDNGKLKARTRHYYDVYMLAKSDEIMALLSDKAKISLIIDDIAKISSVYFPDEEIVDFAELKSCTAFTHEFKGIDEVQQGYIKEKDLYFGERPDFTALITVINNAIIRS